MSGVDAPAKDVGPAFATDLAAVTVSRPAQPAAPPSGGRAPALNHWLAMALVAIVALSIVPLGSNRPAFWTIWGMVLGLSGLAYAGLLLMYHARPRVRVSQFWPEAILLFVTSLYL